MDLGHFWAFLAPSSSVYYIFSLSLSFSLLPMPAPSEAHGITPFFKLESVPSYGSKRGTFQNSPEILPLPLLKRHPDQSTLWEFLFSGPKHLLPHSSAPKWGRLIPPKSCSFLHQSSFFPTTYIRSQRSRPTFSYFKSVLNIMLNKRSYSSTSTDRSFKVPPLSL